MGICRFFWSLSKPAQDALLWTLQCASDQINFGSDSEGSQTRYIAGTQVCRRAFQRMLGVGCGRLNRTRKRFRGKDERSLRGPMPKAAVAQASVDTFMRQMYYSTAESMPTGLLPGGVSMPDEETRMKLLGQLMADALEGTAMRASKLDPRVLSQRELPPGNWAQLFLLYQAHCLAKDIPAASRATFYACTRTWRKTLKFRHRSKHSLCVTCDKLKSQMRCAKGFVEHARFADLLLGHLSLTWRCRQVYWNIREQSRAHQDVLCVIFDGFDKSKPALPRWAHGRLPKAAVFERVNRPHMQVSAALAHGYGCHIYISEEQASCGGSYTWECLFHLMDDVAHACRTASRPMPSSRLVCQAMFCLVV